MRTLRDVAKVIRSKNAGPFELTLDVIFQNREQFDEIREQNLFTPEKVAGLYNIPVENILSLIWFEPAYAVKVTMKRPMPSGGMGETDIYGAQQHAPLLTMEL